MSSRSCWLLNFWAVTVLFCINLLKFLAIKRVFVCPVCFLILEKANTPYYNGIPEINFFYLEASTKSLPFMIRYRTFCLPLHLQNNNVLWMSLIEKFAFLIGWFYKSLIISQQRYFCVLPMRVTDLQEKGFPLRKAFFFVIKTFQP